MSAEKSIFNNTVAIITSVIMIVWMISSYFGSMILHLFEYWYIILPALLLYVISFFNTILSPRKHFKYSKIKIVCHAVVFLLFVGMVVGESDLFKSARILTAIKSDDRYFDTLILRENGVVEMYGTGLLGNTETCYGSYRLKGDLIIFTKLPDCKNAYIPSVMLWDKKQKALFFNQDENGGFIKEKHFLNYFEIVQ